MDLTPTYHRNVFILCCVVFLINCYHDDGLTLKCHIFFHRAFQWKKFVTICPGDIGGWGVRWMSDKWWQGTSVTSLHVGLLVLHAWVSKKTNQKPSFWALTKIHLDSQMNDKGCLIPQSLAENILSKYNLPKTREKRNKHVSWDGMCVEWYKNVRWMEVLERQKCYESIIRPFRLHHLIVPPLISLHFVSKSLYVDEDSTAKNLYFSIIFSERLDYECDLPWTPGICRTDQSKTSYFSKQIFSKVWSLENRTFWRRFYIFHPPGRVENIQLFENNIDTHHKQNPVVESSI